MLKRTLRKYKEKRISLTWWSLCTQTLIVFKHACIHAKSLQSYMTLCDSMGYSLPGSSVHGILRQEYWGWLPRPPPGDLPDPGIKPTSLMSPALAGGFFTTSATWEALELVSVQFSPVTQSCPTLCNPMNCSMPGLPVHHQLLEFTQTNVHRVSDAIQPSHPLSSPSPPAPNPSQHQSLFQWVRSLHEVAKVLEFQL